MSSLYPSLEDMEINKMVQAQRTVLNEIVQSEVHLAAQQQQQFQTGSGGGGENTNNISPTTSMNNAVLYPSLGNFLGLELSEEMIRQNMPEYCQDGNSTSVLNPYPNMNVAGIGGSCNVVAPVTGSAVVSARAQVNHNIREFILCKDAKGKVGLRVQAIDNGVFVCIVVKDSPAALAGVRFGDQILQLNGTLVSGFSVDKIHKMLKASGVNNISVVIRDRPFERTVTLLKDSFGSLGFQCKNGKIVSIVKDSTASRNGVLTNHNLLEINGQTVVALKEKKITKIINEAGQVVKITIIPSFIYDHLVKKLNTSFLRGIMDHSLPEF